MTARGPADPAGPGPPIRDPIEGRSRPTRYVMLLAHHRSDQGHRCLTLPVAGTSLAICARCAGLYPALLIGLGLQALLDRGRLGDLDLYLVLAASAPGLLDFGLGLLDPRSGSNLRRLATGVLLGLGLSRSLWLHARDPWEEVLWIQGFLLGTGTLAFLLVRRWRPPGDEGI